MFHLDYFVWGLVLYLADAVTLCYGSILVL